jgi:prepilin-type N-terminal cleavage/methylation domain-containing protein
VNHRAGCLNPAADRANERKRGRLVQITTRTAALARGIPHPLAHAHPVAHAKIPRASERLARAPRHASVPDIGWNGVAWPVACNPVMWVEFPARVFMSENRGFSIIELLFALAIAGILLAIAMPGFGRYQATMSLKQANAQVLQDVRRARQLAITRRAPVVVRFGTPPSISGITSYTIHVDANADNVLQSNEMITVRNLPNGTRLSAVSLTPVDSLRFEASGLLLLTSAASSGGRIVIANRLNRRDTLFVSSAGVCYQP